MTPSGYNAILIKQIQRGEYILDTRKIDSYMRQYSFYLPNLLKILFPNSADLTTEYKYYVADPDSGGGIGINQITKRYKNIPKLNFYDLLNTEVERPIRYIVNKEEK